MSLSTNITLTVSDYDIKLSRNLKFYENDQLKLIFTLNYWGIDNKNGSTQKVMMPLNALSAMLFIETPLGVDSIESATIEDNVVTFYLTSNQTQHIGVSRMQIQLSDADGCQITLPPMEFEVRENIYDDEVLLKHVLLADESKNVVVDENGNAINTGTQLSAQTYATPLSAEDGSTTTTSQPTKQIKDFNLKTGVNGEEDLLIQDSDGVTKRIKASELIDTVSVDISICYTKEEVNALLENKADVSHTHVVADITDLSIPTVDVNKAYVDAQLETKANVDDIPDLTGYATETFVTNKIAEASLSGGEIDLSGYATKDDLTSGLATKSNTNHTHYQYLTTIPSEYITETELNAKGYLVQSDIAGKANTSDLSDVATSGDYNDLLNKPTIPSAYTLPTASSTTLGGIKVGNGLSIDSNGILSATSSGSSSTGNGIVFNDSHVEDCNTWLSNGYIKTSNTTTNLPSLCTGADRWGVLFYIAENTTTGTGTQMYFPIDGTYKGRVFTRSLTRMSSGSGEVGEWNLLARQSDLEGYATETYVNNKTTPRLVGDSVTNSTLTLTTDKYQYATLSNGNSIVLPTVSSFTEIHLFFKASSDLTLTFPSVRWQSIPSITSGHTYEIVFTYVVDEWLAGIICYQ